MQTCRGEPCRTTPVWFSNQSSFFQNHLGPASSKIPGREFWTNPNLGSELACTAVQRLGVDAAGASLDPYSLLPVLGFDLKYNDRHDPVILNPFRDGNDLGNLIPLTSVEQVHFDMAMIVQTRNDLAADIPLIGCSLGPFTLACAMIDGCHDRSLRKTKSLIFKDPGAWDELMQTLSNSISVYLNGQIDSGVQSLQLLDPLAHRLRFEDYQHRVYPFARNLIASLPADIPVIHSATGNPNLFPLLANTQATVIDIDETTRLDRARQILGADRVIQGNLDPTVLLTGPTEIRNHALSILDQASGEGKHIFNVGSPILPETPIENLIRLVDIVHG